ncbi:MAG: ATP-grasp domain-containing protein [Candidatus Andersenbacteria bacterium]
MMARTLNSSTQLLIEESQRRQIEAVFFKDIDPSTVLLEYQNHRELIYFSRTDRQGSVINKVLENKMLTTALLRHGGFNVPSEIQTDDVAVAEQFLEKHSKVVVKPLGNTGGAGITTGITTREELAPAFERALNNSNIKEEQQRAIVQEHVEGEDCRVLVVDQQHLFGIQRIPAHVTGNGQHSVQELVNAWNDTRKVECRIKLGEETQELLTKQNLTLDSIPAPGQHVTLAYVSNYHAGGQLRDVTDLLGEEVRRVALEMARYFGIGIVGIDFLSPDITQSAGVVIELNGTPDITIHHQPDEGESRNVAGCVIDMLFPETTQH